MKNLFFLCLFALVACSTPEKPSKGFITHRDKGPLELDEGYSFSILFQEKDSIWLHDSIVTLAKGNHDLISYIPINGNSEHGQLFISHEIITINPVLGDGGGATLFEIQKIDDQWQVIGKRHAIDFSPVLATANNCGGKRTPKGTILMAEEIYPTEERPIFPSLDKYKDKQEEFGWIVEVDPTTKKAKQKCYQMGRYVHEDALSMPDSQTVYLTNDDSPAVFFKFIAEKPNDYSKGQLYAYKQDADSIFWLPLTMKRNILNNARDEAIKLGATIFLRHEWLTYINNKIYITETGLDSVNWKPYLTMGGVVAKHFNKLHIGDSIYDDPYGRVLEFDPTTNKMIPFIQGDSLFSNPDGLTSVTRNGKDYLVICEDIIATTRGRSSERQWGNQLWIKDLSTIEKPLKKLLQVPKGAESTGPYFTPDGKSLFLNIQHPNTNNPVPFNRSSTVVIEGF